MQRVVKVAAIAGSTALVGKSAYIILSDEWSEVKYDIKKFYKNMFLDSVEKRHHEERQRPKVVVLGSGWAALSFIQHLDKDEIDLTVVSPRSFFFYTPLLAGACTGTVSQTAIAESIRRYCPHSTHCRFLQAECTSVDPMKKTLDCRASGGVLTTLSYDHLVVAVGADTADFGIPGVREYAIPMKEIEHGAAIQRAVLEKLEVANALWARATAADMDRLRKELRWVVIGGGPSGVELSAELCDFINTDVATHFPHLKGHIRLTLVEATPRLLPVFDQHISDYTAKMLAEEGAQVLCNTLVTRITADTVEVKKPRENKLDGDKQEDKEIETIDCGLAVWAGGIKCKGITQSIRDSLCVPSVQTSRHGLIVDNYLQVKGADSICALGDCAVSGAAPTAQVAYQQGTYLGRRFRDSLLQQQQVGQKEHHQQQTEKSTSDSSDSSDNSNNNSNSSSYPEFKYVHRGTLAYIGSSRGVADLKPLLWERYPGNSTRNGISGNDKTGGSLQVEGNTAYILWRSLYFTKLMSGRNRLQVAGDWFKTWMCGRDISSLELLPASTETADTAKKTACTSASKDISSK